jgi:hypothetical protein
VSGGLSQATAESILKHLASTATYTPNTVLFLAFCKTEAPIRSWTPATFVAKEISGTEWKEYGEGRIEVVTKKWAIAGTSPNTMKNESKLEKACTSGTGATIFGWALMEKQARGNEEGKIVFWGSITGTSVTISTTQQPAVVEPEKLVAELT